MVDLARDLALLGRPNDDAERHRAHETSFELPRCHELARPALRNLQHSPRPGPVQRGAGPRQPSCVGTWKASRLGPDRKNAVVIMAWVARILEPPGAACQSRATIGPARSNSRNSGPQNPLKSRGVDHAFRCRALSPRLTKRARIRWRCRLLDQSSRRLARDLRRHAGERATCLRPYVLKTAGPGADSSTTHAPPSNRV